MFISLVTFLVSDLEPLAVKGEATNIFLCSGLSKQFFSLLRLPCVILILIKSTTGAQPALHFGGGGNFHELSFDDAIVLIQPVVQLFRKRSRMCSFRNISENENLLVLIRPTTRGAKPALKIFSPRRKNVLDIVWNCWTYSSLKIWVPSRKLFAPLVSQAGYGPDFNHDADRTIRTE